MEQSDSDPVITGTTNCVDGIITYKAAKLLITELTED